MTRKYERESTEPPDAGANRFTFIIGLVVLLFVATALFGGPYFADAMSPKTIKSDAFSHHKVPVSPSR